ncbi:hypothetical protein CIPAW_16G057600 [Carya illinoinensis]|uniref:Uncharacterized protein n=1 Tax=Carya illinoinensis TaxID=32201 RepID=A0A8T1N6N3_CARIL|nr:hypothetical protein CIPAW_16G057600 [Carya illinoinensis]
MGLDERTWNQWAYNFVVTVAWHSWRCFGFSLSLVVSK